MKTDRYVEMIPQHILRTVPIKLTNSMPQNILKTNEPLLLSYLAYKFINLKEDILVYTNIHKPSEIIARNDETYDIGIFKCRMYNSENIYSILYMDNKNLTSTTFTSTIVYGYFLFSTMFVKTKIRFISRTPTYIVYESLHGPEIVTSLTDIISRYGITNDSLFKRRCKRIFNWEISRQYSESVEELLEDNNETGENDESDDS